MRLILYYIVNGRNYVNCIIIEPCLIGLKRCKIMLEHRILPTDGNSKHASSQTPRLVLISACFLLGSLLGAYFGAHFPVAEFAASTGFSFLSPLAFSTTAVLGFLGFHIIMFFLGTTYLGVFFIPITALLKGFIFSCESASIISANNPHDIIMALIILGIPALLSVPSFIALGDNAFFRSGKLLALARGDNSALAKKSDPKILLAIPALLLGLLAQFELVPYVLSIYT